MDASAILTTLREALPSAALSDLPAIDMPTVSADRAQIVAVLRTARDHPALQFSLLVELTAVDLHPASPRFEVVYHLVCIGAAYATGEPAPARRLRVKVRLPDGDPRISSVVSVYPNAAWPEREVFDLFGVGFDGHPDLRRILMPEDWEGFPLRKDAPVQIRKEATSWQPLQVTAEEFAQQIRQERDRAVRQLGGPGPAGGPAER